MDKLLKNFFKSFSLLYVFEQLNQREFHEENIMLVDEESIDQAFVSEPILN
ncbi:hypothetical protein GLW08_11060 [Pontibacillus yanchengensis]|uniref:Uncharacterized protein n=1 Tax=Pontibacillus yanchengensis TaxID=462910 RepID=A0ACC7VIC4_9BACI|nr:hypothetical protein [Pontibacillus yanchengensis]